MVMSHDLFAQITGPIEEELRLEREGTVTYEAQCAKLSELQQIHGLEHNEVRTTLRLIQAIWERTDDTQTITTPPQLRKIAGRDYDDAFKETLYFHVTCANPLVRRHTLVFRSLIAMVKRYYRKVNSTTKTQHS